MKKLFLFFLIFTIVQTISSNANAISLYDALAPREVGLFGLGTTAQPKPFCLEIKSGTIDFETEHGTKYDFNIIAGWTTNWPDFKDITMTPGLIFAIKKDESTTAWSSGLNLKINGFSLTTDNYFPFLILAGKYQESSGATPDSLVGMIGAGLEYILAKSDKTASKISVELDYQKAVKDIFFDHADRVDNDLALKVGLTYYPFLR